MTRLLQHIATFLLGLLAKLPFGVLYLLSDFTAFLMYRVVRYRRKMVTRNVADSFPEKSEREVKAIVKEFYYNFADYIVESLKYYKVSAEKLRPRMTFENVEAIERYFAEKRPIVVYFSHCFNWEWVTLLGEMFRGRDDVQLAEVYRPLSNKWMDSMMLDIRTRFNTACFPKTTVFRDLIRLKARGVTTCTGFMSDQKPSHGDRVHIIKFLNHPTAVITGTEIVARKLNAAVIYFDMTKLARGHYHMRIVPICENVIETPDYEVTDAYFRLLEANIRRQPSIWLWSHNRWKHKVEYPADFAERGEGKQ